MNANLLQEYVTLIVEKIKTAKGVKGNFGEKFNLKKFKELETSHMMIVYANHFLDDLGEGSSRAVYLFSSRYALKIATNEKGLAQNQAELDVFTNPVSKQIVAKIHASDHEYKWVISDLVKQLKNKSEFQQLTGIDWEEFLDYVHYYVIVKKSSPPSDLNLPKFTISVIETALSNNLLAGDLKKLDSWGKTPDGRCVLLDYGFTRGVADTHYSSKKKVDVEQDKNKQPTSGQKTTNPLKAKKLEKPGSIVDTEEDKEATKR